ncbi:MAG TPA: response regulator [Herpetosiphonaceae bacterium]|nr:response regulator [Herpetosiphonaceae bacterium]
MARILVVDDQPDNLYVLDRLLKGQGYEVLQADHGRQALEIAQREKLDLILLDVMMPGLDGFEVVRRLRENPATRTIPLVLLTANAPDQRQKIQALNLGADEYLTQPVNNNELLARIGALLRTRQVQNDLLAVNERLRTLLDVIQAGASTLDLNQVGQRLVEGAVRAARVEAGGIWLKDGDEWRCLAEIGYPANDAASRMILHPSTHRPLEQIIAEPHALHGTVADLYGTKHPYGAAFKSAVILPLLHRGSIVGVLQLATTQSYQFSEPDVQFLSALANAAAASVQNARLFEETDRQRRALQALDSEKDEFISIISHELKNPLASIKGYAGLLIRRARKDPGLATAMKGLDVIEQQVNRMTMLLDQLRDVSHIGINRFAIEPQTTELIALVKRVVATAQTTTTDHIIQLDVTDRPLFADVDEFRMEQVLNNLVGNAIKYSPDGGRIEVVVELSEGATATTNRPAIPAGWAVVTVRDYGIGIPAAGRERLFERFFRAGNAKGRVSGMGLGLFIAREIVHRHGGLIWVESEEGQGSLFGIALPLVEAPAQPDAVAEEVEKVGVPS